MSRWVEESLLLKTPYIDLLQLLKATGNAVTGGEAKALVEQGLIRVNGELEHRKRRKLRVGDIVELKDAIRITVLGENPSVGS
ncbi:MAG: RNA-binding S4 domain-containing protein [Bacteroidetes bacterium]|jgi:ribosome-associated protein|nr:RNA-binding S4 domain-containing protein [Bacteroidota bacterium]|tara:strand:+ start:1248 stop:1496 length:249 start_codon:yes stop_codon:yes gene_type:complete